MKINWNKFSAKVQAHSLCRYCDSYAEYMNQRSDSSYDAVCEKHHHDNKQENAN